MKSRFILFDIVFTALYIGRANISLNKKEILWLFIKIRIGALFNKSNQNSKLRIQNFLGFQIVFNSYDALLYSFKEIFIQEIYKFKSNKSETVIIDAGSNIGLSILYFKIQYPSSKILAFEPDNQMLELLQLNISKNNLADITIYPFALSNRIGQANFDNSKGTLRGFLTSNSNQSNLVNEAKLSTFITERVSFLKMDIEGAETRVISDLIAEEKLSLIDNCIVEFHLHQSKNSDLELKNFIELFESNNYSSTILLYGELNKKELLQDVLIQFVKK